MSEKVKPPRRYDSTRRRAQAAQTRRDIVRAARELFVEHGFAGTTLASVAARAGVVVETIYRSFDGKAGLFRAVVEDAVADGGTVGGADAPPDSAVLRPAFEAIIAETDPRRQLALYADLLPGMQARIAPLMRIVTGAAASGDPAMATIAEQLGDQRLEGMQRFAQMLAGRDALRADLTVTGARDVLWTLTSHAVYDLLVTTRGWTPDQYRDWLADTLARSLLSDDPPAPPHAPT
jgi:AcrR family transcriptional regulator